IVGLEDAQLHIEDILVFVTTIEAKNKIGVIREKLRRFLLIDDGENSDVSESKMEVDQKSQPEGNPILKYPSPSVCVCFRPNQSVKLSVDIRTGLICALPLGNLHMPVVHDRLKVLEAGVNADLNNAEQAMVALRLSTVMDEAESYCRFMGLTTIRVLSLEKDQLPKLNVNSAEHLLYVHEPAFLNHYIVFVADDTRDSGGPTLDGPLLYNCEPKYRVVVMAAKLNPLTNNIVIDAVYPVSVTDIEKSRASLPGPNAEKRPRLSSPGNPDDLIMTELNLAAVQSVLGFCRKFITWSLLTSQLAQLSIPFSEVGGPQNEAGLTRRFRPIQFPISINPSVIAASIASMLSSTNRGDGFSRSRFSHLAGKFPFGPFYITLEQPPRQTQPSGEAVEKPVDSDAQSNGTQGQVDSPDFVVGKGRLRLERLPEVTFERPPANNVMFDASSGVITLVYSGIVDATKAIITAWCKVAALAQIVSAIFVRKDWFQSVGWSIARYDLNAVGLEYRLGQEHPPVRMLLSLESLPSVIAPQSPHERLRVTFPDDTAGSFASLKGSLEIFLNRSLDIVGFVKALSRALNVALPLLQIERSANTPENLIKPDKPLVKTVIMSHSFIRFYYGAYVLDFTLIEDTKIALFDGCQPHGSLDGFPAEAGGLHTPLRFFSVAQKSFDCPSIVEDLVDSIKKSEVAGQTLVTPLPDGLAFDDAAVPVVVRRAAAVLETLSQVAWANEQLLHLYPANVVDTSHPLRLLFRTPHFLAGWKVNPMEPSWRFGLQTPPAPPADAASGGLRMTKDILNSLATYLHEKFVSAVSRTGRVRPFLRVLMELISLPYLVLIDLVHFSVLERSSHGQVPQYKLAFEWCFVMPALDDLDRPQETAHLPAPGSPGLIINQSENRISMVIKFTSLATRKSALVALRLNYATAVVGAWRADNAPNGAADVDLTALPPGPFLQDRLRELKANMLDLGLPAATAAAAAASVDGADGGGGGGATQSGSASSSGGSSAGAGAAPSSSAAGASSSSSAASAASALSPLDRAFLAAACTDVAPNQGGPSKLGLLMKRLASTPALLGLAA
ncbi:hypothetical protein HK405_004713, partial [Cladochytrium tenue]